MGRKRFITSDISINKDVAGVAEENPTAGLMWPWFLKELDDWARMNADPVEVKLNVFQAFSFTAREIQETMEAYHRHGLVYLYTVDGRQYLQANPSSFYRLNTYIKESRRLHDGSKHPPPSDHPWVNYWPTSDWKRSQPAKVSDTLQPTATVAEDQQNTATIAHSPSPSPTSNEDEEDARAHEPAEKAECLALINRHLPSWVMAGEDFRELLDLAEELTWPVVLRAVQTTMGASSRHIRYCLKTLRSWKDEGITCLDDLEALEVRRAQEDARRQKQQSRTTARSRDRPSNALQTGYDAYKGWGKKGGGTS